VAGIVVIVLRSQRKVGFLGWICSRIPNVLFFASRVFTERGEKVWARERMGPDGLTTLQSQPDLIFGPLSFLQSILITVVATFLIATGKCIGLVDPVMVSRNNGGHRFRVDGIVHTPVVAIKQNDSIPFIGSLW